jgi:hypothetical protein
MNPKAVRAAIKTGLDARPAWDAVEIFAYPAGGRVTKKHTFELSHIRDGSAEQLDLAGSEIAHDYIIDAQILYRGDAGAKDSNYAETETAALALLADLEAWLDVVKHGKALGVATCDVLEMVTWNLTFTDLNEVVIELALAVTEY